MKTSTSFKVEVEVVASMEPSVGARPTVLSWELPSISWKQTSSLSKEASEIYFHGSFHLFPPWRGNAIYSFYGEGRCHPFLLGVKATETYSRIFPSTAT